MSEKTLCVVSNASQLETCLKVLGESNTTFYCDNPSFYEALRTRRITFSHLDEWTIRNEWPQINAWGCEAAAKWAADAEAKSACGAIHWPAALFLFLSHLLIHAAKMRKLANHCVDDARPGGGLTFISVPKSFPQFNGNGYLNYFLKERLLHDRLTHAEQVCESRSLNAERFFSGPSSKERVKKIIGEALIRLSPGSSSNEMIWTQGSIRHFRELWMQLKKEKIPFLIADESFNFSHYFFCLRNRLSYVLLMPGGMPKPKAAFATQASDEIFRSFDIASAKGYFIFEGHDYSAFVRTLILSGLKDYLMRCAGRLDAYESLGSRVPPKALLTEDDYAIRGGFLAAWARSRRAKVFCLSHANTPSNFEVRSSARLFNESLTFVHSEFERDNYAARGWNPSRIEITGTPRYDRLIRLRHSKARKSRSSKPLILYCANTFIAPQTPDDHGYLGVSLSSFESVTKPAADAILKALNNPAVDVLIKPHNAEGIATWEKLLRLHGIENARIADDPNTDFFKCLHRADAMVLSGWSTGIIEAALMGLPTLYVDLQRLLGPSALNFLTKTPGFAIAKSEAEVVDWVDQLLRHPHLQPDKTGERQPIENAKPNWALGWQDGLSATRVVRRLKAELGLAEKS